MVVLSALVDTLGIQLVCIRQTVLLLVQPEHILIEEAEKVWKIVFPVQQDALARKRV
jgi:hypothetical protein